MASPLRLPAALAFTVLGVAGCGDEKPRVDAQCARYCVYETVDNGNCPFPTCATGPAVDQCPPGCVPQPVA